MISSTMFFQIVRSRLRNQFPRQRHHLLPFTDLLANTELQHPSFINTASHSQCGLQSFTISRTCSKDGLRLVTRTCTHHQAMFQSTQLICRSAFSRHSGFDLRKFKGTNARYYSGGTGLFSPTGMLWTLIGTNVAVYFMWQRFDPKFMDQHFTVSIGSVLNGRIYTILTSAFSQMDLDHLLSNMIGLFFFGSEIGRIFGAKYLLTWYLAGAVGGALGHMFYFAYVYPWLQNIPRGYYNSRYSPRALGASGAVTTVMLLHIFLYPKQIILFQMFIPMPAALLGAIIIGRNLWLARQGDSNISVGGHLGGALVAFLAYLSIRKPWLY